MKSLTFLSLVTFSLVCNFNQANARSVRPKVIYGEDDRREMFQVDSALWQQLSSSTAAMVDSSLLEKNVQNNLWVTVAEVKSLSNSPLKLCPSETYADQPFLATCSGFLVAEDLLVTAGHCVAGRMETACANFKWVFDYKVEQGQDPLNQSFTQDSVYGCKEVLAKAYAPGQSKLDYALIRLDRKVVGRRPLALRKTGKVEKGAKLVIAGYPWGLPLKVSSGAQVMDSSDDTFFSANLDSFQGNSGSAVFNQQTGEVEGILVRGRSDAYVTFSEADGVMCRKINRCSEDGTICNVKADQKQPMEGVTRIAHLVEAIEKFKQ